MSHNQRKRRKRQKWRVLKAQEKLIGMNPYDFAALMTALDSLDDLAPTELEWGVKLPREPTTWEKIRQFLFGSEDAKSN